METDALKIHLFTVEQRAKWNAFVANGPTFALLQAWEWGEFKEKMGWKVYRVAVEEGGTMIAAAQMLVKPIPGGWASLAYIPRGPLIDWADQNMVSCLLAELHRIARQERAIFLRIEPPLSGTPENHLLLQRISFRSSSNTNQPRNTILIDIQPGLESILTQMRQKTRQYIRRAGREGINMRIGNREDLPAYIELMRLTGKREHFPVRNCKYYALEYEALAKYNRCVLLLAEQNGKLLAARTIYAFGSHASEFHAGSAEGIDHLHPNFLLVWEGIQWAKGMGCETYDLWGIPDEITGNADEDERSYLQRKDGLWGVYRFKSGFSTNVVSYVGAYDYVYASLPYAALTMPFVNRDAMERVSVWADSIKKK